MTRHRELAVVLLALFSLSLSGTKAESEPDKKSKHHKLTEWLSLLSRDSREKLRNAKREALKDPSVRAAKARRDQAEAEYRKILHREMLKADPSLKRLLEAITDLQKRDDF